MVLIVLTISSTLFGKFGFFFFQLWECGGEFDFTSNVAESYLLGVSACWGLWSLGHDLLKAKVFALTLK